MDKYKILSSIVGVIMVISIIKPWVAAVVLGCLGAGLWIKGKKLLG